MPSPPVRYRFGLFEADPASGQLLKQSRPIKLQDQPFQLLLTLLEANGAVVTRDDLRQRLWREDTFVEFDKSLGVALAKLRAALGDAAANPRFVETIPKRGYRFIAPIETIRPAEPAPAAPPATPALPASSPVTAHNANGGIAAITMLVILAAGAAGFFSWRYAIAGHLPARAGIVVANFTNSTGDSVFDGSLRRAAIMGLAQSPYLHVLSDATIGEVLQGLGRPPDQILTSGLARETCQRAHAAALVEGSIQHSGGEYTLVVQATRCGDGTVLARERAGVSDRDQVVAALGRQVELLRRRFGEPDASLQSYNAPIEVATTDSLDALRAYQLGMELRARADNLKAIPALKTAIALDPQFAIAYAQLGSSYSNMGNVDQGTPFFRKAFDLRDRATAPERLYITGRYFDIVTGDLEKASETYRQWTEIYPDDWLGFNALSNDANQMGRYEAAAAAARQTIVLEPNRAFGYTNLIIALVSLHRFTEAAAVCSRALERFPDNWAPHVALYDIAAFARDNAAMTKEIAWSNAHLDHSEILYAEAKFAALRGRPAESARLFDEAARRERDAGNAETPANALAIEAQFQSLMGRTDAALHPATAALAMAHNEVVVGLGALVYAIAGHQRDAQQLLDGAAEHHPLSTLTMGVYTPMAKAVLASAGRDASLDAVNRALAPGGPYTWGQEGDLAPGYIRGMTCLQLHAWADAAGAFQGVIDHIGVDPVSPLYALSYLGLARADAGLRRIDASRKAYATVLDLWKGAEPDFALASAARREFATLH
jgi:DNA-binding winged helix-turn-helix (wHTH) protein/tetratricopeptide (TPR) repeat protein